MDRSADRRSAGDLATSLRYALMAESVLLDAKREVPVSVLQAIAALSKSIGEQTLAQARVAESTAGAVGGADLKISDLSEAVRGEIKRSLFDAGEYYRKVAHRVSASDESGYRDAPVERGRLLRPRRRPRRRQGRLLAVRRCGGR